MTRSIGFNLKILFVFIYCASVFVDADFSTSTPNILVNNIVYSGNGSVSSTDIVLTLAEIDTDTVVYWTDPQNVQFGFNTSIIYTSTDCDAGYSGGDGFAFFFAKAINLTDPRSPGGNLGVRNKTNLAVVGFDMWQGYIVYKAISGDQVIGPRADFDAVSATDIEGWRCYPGNNITVQLVYTPPTFRILSTSTVNVDVSITMNLQDYFDSNTKMYVGLSGGTGQGYMKQSVTYWQFAGNPPPSSIDVVPFLECYEQLDNSTYLAHMGYNNPTPSELRYSVGPSNSFNPSPQSRGQPTTFPSGRSPYYPLNSFSFQWDGSDVTWNLTSYFVTFNGANTALLCPKSLSITIVFTTAQNLTNTQITTILQSIANFLEISSSRVTLKNITYVPQVTKRSIAQSGLEGTLELEIGDTNSQTQNEPSAAESVQKFVSSASNSTLVNEVLNPPGTDTTVNFVSLTSKPTGVEGTGSLIVEPPIDVSVEPVTPPSTPVSAPVSVPIVGPRSTANERSVMWMSLVLSATVYISLF